MIKLENRENGRYYYIQTEQDLLKAYIIIVYRGGKDKNCVDRHQFWTANERQRYLDLLLKRRFRNGYKVIC